MLQIESHPLERSQGVARSRQLYLILYPKELEEEVIQTLESAGVPGYTEMPKMVGRGQRVRHFDNAVWPGATGAVFTVVAPDEAQQALVPSFRALAAKLDSRSHGLYGLHMFALPCEQLI